VRGPDWVRLSKATRPTRGLRAGGRKEPTIRGYAEASRLSIPGSPPIRPRTVSAQPAQGTREQPSITPTMPANTAQSDPTEPLRTADLPLRHTENGASSSRASTPGSETATWAGTGRLAPAGTRGVVRFLTSRRLSRALGIFRLAREGFSTNARMVVGACPAGVSRVSDRRQQKGEAKQCCDLRETRERLSSH
jgi:hypothetical protein